eukprot:CAMPEP_0167762056 /NCGR_PEP_ID=MMETSP0110_2-20121227/12531_1 /TAXON_ID=629695 /ORGANISM="Gymnochlora sp., Strain CCMP2014" /LENGTH=511 /DNA_ID=CAMNT_0007648839 /DNA_START=27 /DNA_END=1562 /DNA_ORIENTATION=+
MPLRVVIKHTSPDGKKFDQSLSIKVPKKYWSKESKHLIEWFTDYYNKKFEENKLDPEAVELLDGDGKVYPSNGIIQECFSHKQEIQIRKEGSSNNRAEEKEKEEKGEKEGKAAVTLNSVVDMENPDEFSKAEGTITNQYKTHKKNHGLKHDLTLKAAFQLMDICIGQYKLDKIDRILLEIKDVCSDTSSSWHTKYIQMKAFCRWKQSKFKEALELFEEMKLKIGKSSKLFENMGHTHNSLGNYEKAQQCFQEALHLVDVELKMNPQADSHKGGLYMGLGIVKKRQGKVKEGLEDLLKSLKWYQDTTGPKPHSLVAKAHMSIGHAYEELKEFKKAASHMESAVDIFYRTCGNESPLTGGARGSLGKVYVELNMPQKAWDSLVAAFKNEVKHDSLKVFTLFEHASLIYKLYSSKSVKNVDAGELMPSLKTLDTLLGAQMKVGLVKRDGNVGALYKSMAEVAIIAQYYKLASLYLNKALTHFGEEKSFDCGKLIQECRQVLQLVHDLIRKGKGY